MLSQDDWIAFHSYLFHVWMDITCVVRFAESIIFDCSYVVKLQEQNKVSLNLLHLQNLYKSYIGLNLN